MKTVQLRTNLDNRSVLWLKTVTSMLNDHTPYVVAANHDGSAINLSYDEEHADVVEQDLLGQMQTLAVLADVHLETHS